MHRRHTAFLLLLLATFTVPRETTAQPRWLLELVPGGAFVTEDPPALAPGPGLGVEGLAAFRFIPDLAVYVAWDWRRFASGSSVGGADVDLEETGYSFGLRFEQSLGAAGSPAIMIRVGGLVNRVEIAGADNEPVDSDEGIGWELGGGVAFPVQRITLTPAVRFRAIRRDFDVGGAPVPASFGYAIAELGIGVAF